MKKVVRKKRSSLVKESVVQQLLDSNAALKTRQDEIVHQLTQMSDQVAQMAAELVILHAQNEAKQNLTVTAPSSSPPPSTPQKTTPVTPSSAEKRRPHMSPSAMRVFELRAELRKRGLKTSGLKRDLVQRLKRATASSVPSTPNRHAKQAGARPSPAPRRSSPLSTASIYERCKQARLSRGLTQKDLAKVLGATAQNVSYWERGMLSKVSRNNGAALTQMMRKWLAGK